MKKTVLLFLFLVFNGLNLRAQQTNLKYGISYDPSGNRILRYKIIPRLTNPLPDSVKEAYSQNEGALKITVFPNPSRGNLSIEIQDPDRNNSGTITVFDNRGNLIAEKNFIGNKTSANLTNQPAGEYIIRVTTVKTSKEWLVSKSD